MVFLFQYFSNIYILLLFFRLLEFFINKNSIYTFA